MQIPAKINIKSDLYFEFLKALLLNTGNCSFEKGSNKPVMCLTHVIPAVHCSNVVHIRAHFVIHTDVLHASTEKSDVF